MKKVLLLGDSIRMGYDDYVKEILQGKCEVYYAADENGRFSAFFKTALTFRVRAVIL